MSIPLLAHTLPTSDADDFSAATAAAQTEATSRNAPLLTVAPYLHSLSPSSSSSPPSESFPASSGRWCVLLTFCLLSSNQSLLWITFSPITDSAKAYYRISEAACDLLLNWGPIIYLPSVLLTAHLSSTSRGMRQLILASAWTCFLCAILRVLPEMPHAWNSEHAPDEEGVEQYGLHNWLPHSSAIYFLHVSCILNAAVGPMCMATVAKISCVWFPAEERTISTAIAITGGSLGSSLGFIFGPILVPDSSPESMPIYLLVQLLLCTIALLACLIYMPAKPSHYPSPAARTLDTTLPVPFLPSLVEAFRHRDLMLLSISNGILNGTFNCWAGVLSTILPDVGQTTCGWLSFGATASSSTSSVLIGLASTDRRVRTRLKSLCIISSALTALLLAWFSLSTSSSVLASYALLPSSQGALFSAVILAGLALGVAIPLAYEFAAEMTYPLPEGVSGGVLSGVNNAAGIVFLFLSPACSGRTMNALMVMTAVGCTLLLVPVREVYRRMDEEEEDKERVDGYQKMDDHTSDGMATSKAGQQHMSLNGTTATR